MVELITGMRGRCVNGTRVRILAVDRMGSVYPIVALVRIQPDKESVVEYTIDGKRLADGIFSGLDIVTSTLTLGGLHV